MSHTHIYIYIYENISAPFFFQQSVELYDNCFFYKDSFGFKATKQKREALFFRFWYQLLHKAPIFLLKLRQIRINTPFSMLVLFFLSFNLHVSSGNNQLFRQSLSRPITFWLEYFWCFFPFFAYRNQEILLIIFLIIFLKSFFFFFLILRVIMKKENLTGKYIWKQPSR